MDERPVLGVVVVEPLLNETSDHALSGRFHMQRALVFKRYGGGENLDRALIENAAASFHLERANHKRYCARVENNTGSILLEVGRYADAHHHLDKARQIFVGLKDTSSVAQVNETRARVYLAQSRFSDAERTAFAAVSALEQGEEHSLLAEALITQGIARARMGRIESAQSLLQRAAVVATAAGDLVTEDRVYLVLVEELQHWVMPAEAAALFREADSRLGHSKDAETMARLLSCARIIIDLCLANLPSSDLLIGGSLSEERKRYEGELIKRALDREKGSARRLGLSHQALSYILKNRHNSLLSARTPVRKRYKSIIKK
jgi:tetratricopeptide (TPR) repeat protein